METSRAKCGSLIVKLLRPPGKGVCDNFRDAAQINGRKGANSDFNPHQRGFQTSLFFIPNSVSFALSTRLENHNVSLFSFTNSIFKCYFASELKQADITFER